jgi:DNA-binding NarL/FixJ family response regulator
LGEEIFVAILEDDIFSLNWMALLMVREWRTRVVGEFTSRVEFREFLEKAHQRFDVLILDVDLISEIYKITDICQALQSKGHQARILLTGIQQDPKVLLQVQNEQIGGYVLKSEVAYALSWVIAFVSEGHWVLTPGVQKLAYEANVPLPSNALVVDGRRTIPEFTDYEAAVARMAFIFSVGRRDLADELKISEQWSYGLVSELYKKLGLADIIAGDVDLFSYIGESEIIKDKFLEIMEQLGSSKKARDMETLAFHLMTMPEILE